MPEAATVLRRTLVADGLGGQSVTWAEVATVPCRRAQSQGQPVEQVVAGQLRLVVLWHVTLPAGTDVLAADRIAVGPQTFEVIAPGGASYETARRTRCVEVS